MTNLEKKLLFASLLALTLSVSFLYADEEEEKPETAKGDDVSASTECPSTTEPASKRAKKPVRKATKKNAKS